MTEPTTAADLADIPLTRIDGTSAKFGDYADGPVLVVNVASRCGLAPQYEQLEELQQKYGERGFTVLGFPSNQFAQELKTSEDISEYCSTTWGVTFPMFEKTKVNGRHKHPLYAELHRAKDPSGLAGPVVWNFEKFLVLPSGEVRRFRPTTKPDDPAIVDLIEANLPPAQNASDEGAN
ncbi:glutathione peroxidase [Salinibacterium hongtaonis]|uniref:Glutathione peroxidase n=1 Tax=Homoserinimonas hongtaonis TaxID=2079791 RepID=A0A2U1T319_9MICO|nr:glutathione peroxidase [Salinibacterium hongtaonis]PWB98284.1 glutathione peroxidase [Salinibacterium hongtaonis]